MPIGESLVLDCELELKPHLGPEFFQIEIPAAHTLALGNRPPHQRTCRLETPLDYERTRFVICLCHVFRLLEVPPNTLRADRSSPPRISGIPRATPGPASSAGLQA